MAGIKFAAAAASLATPDGLRYEVGTRLDNSVWDADDPLVLANPRCFSNAPPHIARTQPNEADNARREAMSGPLSQATRDPRDR